MMTTESELHDIEVYHPATFAMLEKDMLALVDDARRLQARIAEMMPNACLGAAVRGMDLGHDLWRTLMGNWCYSRDDGSRVSCKPTPDAAMGLEEAK